MLWSGKGDLRATRPGFALALWVLVRQARKCPIRGGCFPQCPVVEGVIKSVMAEHFSS